MACQPVALATSSPTLLARQQDFARYVGLLIDKAYELGWAFTFGDANRPDMAGHMRDSCHYIRLAVDLNLFVGGVWQQGDCPEYHTLGDFWKSLDPDCRWGGDFPSLDLNHYSIAWKGRA